MHLQRQPATGTTKRVAGGSGRLGVQADQASDRLARRWLGLLFGPSRPGRYERFAAGVRWAAAAVFLTFGAGKFANHASELASFRHYAVPAPSVLVYAIGVLEIVGGLLLAGGLLVRPAALALAADMVGAIVISGIARGENVSLTLAPALLVAMVFLIWAGAGSWSIDRRRATHFARQGRAVRCWRC